MSKRLYPLNALRAFESAARELSFVKAADELNVTPAAVSHQIKKLEDYLGAQLFRRLPRGLVLAEAGGRLLAELGDAFGQLDRAVERVRAADAGGALTISVAPMFAVKWLLPRLQAFGARHPEIDVRLSASLALVDFQRDAFDAAIRLGRGPYPRLAMDVLFEEAVTPMVSPRLVEGGAMRLEDLARLTLLHDDSMAFDPDAPNWEHWLAAAGAAEIDAARGPRFAQPDHALQAAIDGAGVVLGWRHLAGDDLAARRLVAPFDLTLPLGSAFAFVCPESFADRPKIRAFRAWLLGETGAARRRPETAR